MYYSQAVVLVSFVFAASGVADEVGVPLHGDCSAVFASIEEGKAALKTRDRFTNALSRFDLESRLMTNGEATTDALLEFAANQVVPWSDADREKLNTIIASVRKRLERFDLPLPKQLLLIQTTGKDEGNAAYCRRHAIIFPTRYIAYREPKLERIFIHELFHVLSNQNEELRRKLYAIIGYQPCAEIVLPEVLAERKITNPDGPSLRYYIEVASGDTKYKTVPLLYAASRYDAAAGGSFFKYLQFKLLAVEESNDEWSAVLKDDEPVLIDPAQTPSYHEQIGKNTKYIIHPDEILADNFVHLVMESKELPTPRVVEEMLAVLDNHERELELDNDTATRQRRDRNRRRKGVPAGFRSHRDLEYATIGEQRLLLDVYAPEKSSTARPLIVWVHGGAWRSGNKDRCPALRLLTEGYVVASVNYRLSYEAVYPAQIQDCRAAIRWLRANAEKYSIDPDRIGVWGSSAGGHLVALLGTSGDVESLEGTSGNLDHSSRVQAVCDFFGPTDFLQMDTQALPSAPFKHDAPDSPESIVIGGPIQENKDKVARANPVTYVTPDDPPFLVVHGDKDPLVPWQQSRLLVEALRRKKVDVEFHIVKGAGHGFGNNSQVDKMVSEFFARILTPERR